MTRPLPVPFVAATVPLPLDDVPVDAEPAAAAVDVAFVPAAAEVFDLVPDPALALPFAPASPVNAPSNASNPPAAPAPPAPPP